MILDSILWGMANPKCDWQSIVADEIHRHPSMTPDDLHKLVYQAIHGGNHLLHDPDGFRAALHAEWDELPRMGNSEGTLQCIDPEGRTARLHLSPCKALGCERSQLTMFLLSQPLKQADPDAVAVAWTQLQKLARCGRIPFSAGDLQFSPDREIGHHSPAYGPAAYRIVHDLQEPSTREALCRLGLLA